MKREFALSTSLHQVSKRLNDDSDLGLEVESLSNGNYRIFKDEPVGFFKHGLYSLSCIVSATSVDETKVQLKGKINIAVILMAIAGFLPLLSQIARGKWNDSPIIGMVVLVVPVAMWLIYRFHINSLVKKVEAFLQKKN